MLQYVTTVRQYIVTACLSSGCGNIQKISTTDNLLMGDLKYTVGEKYVFSLKGKQEKSPTN